MVNFTYIKCGCDRMCHSMELASMRSRIRGHALFNGIRHLIVEHLPYSTILLKVFKIAPSEVFALKTVNDKICELSNLYKNSKTDRFMIPGVSRTNFIEGMKMFIKEYLNISGSGNFIMNESIIELILRNFNERIESDESMEMFRKTPDLERGVGYAGRIYIHALREA